jgi:hypothetical protein
VRRGGIKMSTSLAASQELHQLIDQVQDSYAANELLVIKVIDLIVSACYFSLLKLVEVQLYNHQLAELLLNIEMLCVRSMEKWNIPGYQALKDWRHEL